ncbi:MAG: ATP-dependent dethiobiotin synthetase BioD, partial [Sphingobacteriales bacterium]
MQKQRLAMLNPQLAKNWLTNGDARVHPELYLLKQPASPHIAAQSENRRISIQKICESVPRNNRNLIIEGAGGLMVP